MARNKSQFCLIGTGSSFSSVFFHYPVEISFYLLVNVKKQLQKTSILSLCWFFFSNSTVYVTKEFC